MSLFSFIKSNISIADVVNEYVTLKKTGIYHKGPCPFHSEKTASFTVSPHRQIFYCFGCQAGGDVIAFISKIENCSQFEAAQHLIDRYHMDVPAEFTSSKTKQEISAATDDKKRHFELCKAVADWCAYQLSKSAQAKNYLTNRGFGDASAQRYSIGYFPGGPGAVKTLIQDLGKKNFLASDLLEAHILSEGKNIMYSPFEERIIFPIKDHLGRYCAFGGRIFRPHDERAKYYNSRENNYFTKGSILFGLDQAKKPIQEQGFALLVEGYTDCIAMAQQTILNTVATLGTACTEEHLKLLARYANQLYVLYDGDNAGQKAILRLTETCWNANLELKVVCLPKGEDPASFCLKGGDIHTLIRNAQDIFRFMIDVVGKDFATKTLNEKLTTTSKLIGVINAIENPIKRDLLLSQAAIALDMPRESLAQEITAQPDPTPPKQNEMQLLIEMTPLERTLFAAILMDFTLLEKVNAYFIIDYFTPLLKEILSKLTAAYAADQMLEFPEFFDQLTEAEKLLVNRILLVSENQTQAKTFDLLIHEFHKKHWKTIVSNVKEKISSAQKAGDILEVQKLLAEFQELKKTVLRRSNL
ncbi:MAG: DNA primase [Candidatus Babeliales bacterium]